uniref:Uncharacterized protein n=1 Tax=Anguilla anguilla TaxID=7936 RepID=A0A0E9V8H1_ANGAN
MAMLGHITRVGYQITFPNE